MVRVRPGKSRPGKDCATHHLVEAAGFSALAIQELTTGSER
jgi:hypothetical protein